MRKDANGDIVRSRVRMRGLVRHPRWLAWSVQNRWKGYRFGPIQRHRCCDHTTPSHYRWCAPSGRRVSGD